MMLYNIILNINKYEFNFENSTDKIEKHVYLNIILHYMTNF